LAKGRLRFYQRDEDGQLEFVGENDIDHTPKEETVRVYTGNAFDIVGERKRTVFRVDNSNNWADEAFEITLRNRKSEAVEVRVVEHLFRGANWEVREHSDAFTRLDAQKIEFRIKLEPDQEKKLTYLSALFMVRRKLACDAKADRVLHPRGTDLFFAGPISKIAS
jgi:hypothetical protein